MRIYTKTGDKGETSLFSGKRVPKHHECIEGYGTVDELNSSLGLAIAQLKNKEIKDILCSVQETLFRLGSDLATPIDDKNTKAQTILKRIEEKDSEVLENWINKFDAKLSPLKNFILPGGSIAGATLHVARTICRRSERWVSQLVKDGKTNPQCLIYMNRLSDFLFVLARSINQEDGCPEKIWTLK